MAGPRLRVLAVLLTASPPLLAQGWGGALGYGTDNVYRGVSLSSGESAWLADLHYEFDRGWVAGVGASREKPAFQQQGVQYTFYLDRRWQVDEDWSAKLGLIHYESPHNVWQSELNYNELTAALSWRGRWRLALALSPDTPGIFSYLGAATGFAASAEVSYRQPLYGRLAADFGLGLAHLHKAELDYAYGSAGLSYGIGNFNIYTSLLCASPGALRYNTGSNERSRWVTTLVWSF